MLGTLILPISERDYIFPHWEQSLQALVLPKHNMKVVLSDATGGSKLGLKAEKIVRALGFSKTEIVRFKQQPLSSRTAHWEHFLKIGLKCAETYEAAFSAIEGPLLFGLEDDIIAPANSFAVLLETFLSKKQIGLISACTYNKQINNETEVIGHDLKQQNISVPVNSTGTLNCSHLATGCFITYSELFKNFHLKDSVLDEHKSPDFSYSTFLRKNHNLDVTLSLDVKTKHIFYRQHQKFFAGLIQCPNFHNTFPKQTNSYLNIDFKSRTRGAPVFIIGFSPRTGSTLIQRLLCSIPNTMIWGEPRGAVAEIYRYHLRILEINKSNFTLSSQHQYNKHGYKGFIPHISPIRNQFSSFKDHLRSLFELHFNHNKLNTWGFKVIDWSPQMVSRLHALFPEASFIFLSRDFNDVKESINRRKSWWPNIPIENWQHAYNQMKEYTQVLPKNMHALVIDFDNYKNKISELCDVLESELEFKTGAIDRTIIDDYVSDLNDAERLYSNKVTDS
ncbi:MAG: sulfotransferase [Gammaproteobacteria bacterium]|nr:sulfotransferase [Gammaproteobacteria bacterium]